MEIGQKIKLMRESKGMTLEELGNMVGVGKSTVRKWENGIIANMRRDKIAKLAEVFDCSPAFLLGYNDTTSCINVVNQNNFPISDLEKQIINKFREADLIEQEMVLRALGIQEKREAKKLG